MTNTHTTQSFTKRVPGAVLAIILVCAMMLSLTSCKSPTISEKSPDVLLQEVEAAGILDSGNQFLSYYENLRNANTDSAMEGTATLSIADNVLSFLEQTMGPNRMELDWINDLKIDVKIVNKGDLTQIEEIFSGKSGKALSLSLIMDDSKFYLSIPELFQKTLLLDTAADSSPVGTLQTEELLRLLPDSGKIAKLAGKYVPMVLACFRDVTKTSETLTANGVAQSCTALKARLVEKDAADAIRNVLNAAKKDDELKALLQDLAPLIEAVEADKVEKDGIWEEFCDAVDEMLNELDEEPTDDEPVFWTTYVDEDNRVIGRRIEDVDGSVLFHGKTVEGNTWGFELYLTDEGEEQFSVKGGGTKTANMLDATFDLAVGGENMLTLQAKELDLKKMESGLLNGKFKLIPSGKLMEEVFDMDGAFLLSALAVELEVSGDRENAECTFAISSADTKLLSLTVSTKAIPVPDIQIPGNTVTDPDRWTQSMDINALLDIIQKLGLPESLFAA